MMLTIAVELGYEVHTLDVQTAFLNANVEEDVFVKMAPGYEFNDKAGHEAQEELVRSPAEPEEVVRHDGHEAHPIESDPCMYVYENETGVAILMLYADNILFLSTTKTLLNKLKKQLIDRFKMSDIGDVSRIIGMNVTRGRNKGAITINQKDYTENMVQCYGMEGYNPAYITGVGPELSLNQPEKKRCFQASTGALMYFAQVTRCDILYTVSQLARAMSKPAKAHVGADKHLLHYLTVFTDLSITYRRDQACYLLGYQLGQQSQQRHVYVTIHRDAGQYPDQLQRGTVGADHTVHDGGRARGGSSSNEGRGVLLQHDIKAGLRREL